MEFYPPEKLRSLDPLLAGRAGVATLRRPTTRTLPSMIGQMSPVATRQLTGIVGSVRGVVANCDKSGRSYDNGVDAAPMRQPNTGRDEDIPLLGCHVPYGDGAWIATSTAPHGLGLQERDRASGAFRPRWPAG
jgi:hypothetical protein